MKKLSIVACVLILMAWASTAFAVQMVWEETNSDILYDYVGDTDATSFYDGQGYTVNIDLVAPGYNTLTWSVSGIAMQGWESSGPYTDTLSISAILNGEVLETSDGYLVEGADGEHSFFFNIHLGLDDLTPPYAGALSITTSANLTGDVEYWNLTDAELNSCDPVPEPATLLLLGSGLVGLAFLKRRKS